MLSYSQVHSLKEHGFLILEPEYTTQNIISDKNISLLRNEIERLIAEEGPTGGSDHLEEVSYLKGVAIAYLIWWIKYQLLDHLLTIRHF